jgi:hypothetical protein
LRSRAIATRGATGRRCSPVAQSTASVRFRPARVCNPRAMHGPATKLPFSRLGRETRTLRAFFRAPNPHVTCAAHVAVLAKVY